MVCTVGHCRRQWEGGPSPVAVTNDLLLEIKYLASKEKKKKHPKIAFLRRNAIPFSFISNAN